VVVDGAGEKPVTTGEDEAVPLIITVADVVGFRRNSVLRPMYMRTLLSSGLLEEPDCRMVQHSRRWPMPFVVHVIKDEWEFQDSGGNAGQVDHVLHWSLRQVETATQVEEPEEDQRKQAACTCRIL